MAIKANRNLKPSLIVTRFLILTFIHFNMDNSEKTTVPTNSNVYQYFKNYQAKEKKQKTPEFIVSRARFHHPHCWAILPHFQREKKEN